MQDLLPQAERLAALLIARRHTIAVAESSAGGLVSAALLAVPGASAFFLGGAVLYTATARATLLGITPAQMHGIRAASPPYAALLADTVRARLATTWGLGETGAAGPSGNRYGDAPGHACLAVAGPAPRALTLATAGTDRPANMRAFAAALLDLATQAVAATPPSP